jgi:integrase
MRAAADDASTLPLTAELVIEFRNWLLHRPQPATRLYANSTAHRLFDWIEDLGGRDLRKLDLRTLRECLERRAGKKGRIIAIKSFFSWLRTERMLVDRRVDPTLDLIVPPALPAKWKKRKAVPASDVRKAMKHLAPAERDCLLLMANTGWHLTELERFIRDEEAGIAAGKGAVLAVLQVRHKIGHTTRTPLLNAEAVSAAERLRKRRQVPRWLTKKLKKACRDAGVPEFGFGVLRHSVATWAIEAGSRPDVVAEFLGHKSKSTTLRFYADVSIPSSTVKLPKFG